ncbi:putative bifunctional diguanylate cyclase/phosphodiesterase [Qipengyuania flava]|uniref:putative bifunctional diguanylate cyclase/phosphodiesterase n=1 Tax=Qipengyuania flava TaxID=192812 RepID=UPI001C62B22E|nr:EAL domain-containing protein [Qipengyuania flava]QYJ07070.1 EAL domain-containing protein [Qipengyuania flava]
MATEQPATSQAETHGSGEAEAVEHLLLTRRLEDFTRGGTLALLPLLGSIVGLVFTFREQLSLPILLGWGALQLALLGLFMVIERQVDPDTAALAELRRNWNRFAVIQWIGSLAWALIFPYLALVAQGLDAVVLAVVAVTVLTGVLLVHRTAPRLALFHIFAMTISIAACIWILAGERGWPAFILLAFFVVALLGSTREQEREIVSGARSEVSRREAAATVGLLLNDYEEHSSDWLWTVGPRGNLRDVTARFAAASGKSVEDLEGVSLIALFAQGEDRDRLARQLMERSAFRDLVLKLRVDGEVRYWKLSARPRADGRMSGVARDVTSDRLIEERVAFMAHYDNLTGLANRYLFNERLRRALSDEERARGVALFYLDLDDFKAVNDTRGHLVGDRLLREVGTRLEREVRGHDLVARLGGDEFAVLLETRAGAGMLIERAHRFLSVIREPFELDDQVYRISGSIGIAKCVEGDCEAEELMRRADLALFAAKKKGRDTLALFDQAMDRAARERREVETDLREAIARGQLNLHYQPVIDLDTGEVSGYEALLRWYHPRRGIVTPAGFLDVAEETGMIVPIGEWVIRQALAETAQWEGDFRIAINLSPTQVRSPHLADVVAQAIHAHGVAPERVEFEITEHVLLQESGVSAGNLEKLRELGTKVALDDFGVGYSSLSYLRRFPFDRIKIDRAFVDGVERDPDNQAIVSSITRLADALGMTTTAEGVETRAQLDLLRKLGCQEAQGYLICEPVPGENFATPAAVAAAMQGEASGILDYRKGREAVLKRRASRAR